MRDYQATEEMKAMSKTMYSVLLRSADFGDETFEYDTAEERQDAVLRLMATAQAEYERDGICRELVILIGSHGEKSLTDWADAIATRIADEALIPADDGSAASVCLRRVLVESLGFAPGAGGHFLQTALAHLNTEGQQAENAAKISAYLKAHPDLIDPLVGSEVIEEDYFDEVARC